MNNIINKQKAHTEENGKPQFGVSDGGGWGARRSQSVPWGSFWDWRDGSGSEILRVVEERIQGVLLDDLDLEMYEEARP